ncbi:S-adenosylmethionine:tRNA ribosyltransferase-isomerase [Trichinella pseudospiralis]
MRLELPDLSNSEEEPCSLEVDLLRFLLGNRLLRRLSFEERDASRLPVEKRPEFGSNKHQQFTNIYLYYFTECL